MGATTDQQMNGYRLLPHSGPGEILYHHAEALGEIRVELRSIHRRLDDHSREIQELRAKSLLGLGPIHWVQVGIGITVLGAAITGRMSWGESLPIVGKMFAGM